MAVSAVIVAGGSGTRFGLKKQFITLGGVPLIRRAVESFVSHPEVGTIVVVVPQEDMDLTGRLISEVCPALHIVQGGRTRQESVYNGLKNVPGAGTVLIHDAVRPLVTGELISRVLAGIGDADGCIPALAVSSTIKEVDGEMVKRTVPRSNLFEAQTPQAFGLPRILGAHTRARQRGVLDATDDGVLIENEGGTIRIVQGDPYNIKITLRKDLELAEAMLACRTGSV
ncbi:MAG: 2-C-methyl-D-erythritol 4-phosphate cytidylyltransferase [Bacteriovoracaceae bacterium]|nr:2-C-methyl-D-erythritol 4-phosphate cytidylyltransferase [Bacteriovoracaceae bacterium]HRC99270.1 2-C-methyl-D-erythritol 4-phosphate cytidylyltransferase [Deltaproteobacteria bacterium]HRT46197.1 2-C-methyl-D-erythritol 4-phosphate cytidylyltransferase [Desulfomonilia bacterium]